VFHEPARGRYGVQVEVNRRHLHLGWFKDWLDAGRVAVGAKMQLHGMSYREAFTYVFDEHTDWTRP
jgi:hypothetical protein